MVDNSARYCENGISSLYLHQPVIIYLSCVIVGSPLCECVQNAGHIHRSPSLGSALKFCWGN